MFGAPCWLCRGASLSDIRFNISGFLELWPQVASKTHLQIDAYFGVSHAVCSAFDLTAYTAHILFELVCRICESDNEYDALSRTRKVSEDLLEDLWMRDPQTTAHILQQDMLYAISWRELKPFRVFRGGKAQDFSHFTVVDHMVQFNEPSPSLLQESASVGSSSSHPFS